MALEVPVEINSPWYAVIRSKYGPQANGWDSNIALQCSSRNPWKDISYRINSFTACFQFFIVGNGEKVRFWEERGSGRESYFIPFL